MSDFGRTLQTAQDAEDMARLLLRAAERKRPLTYLETERLKDLAGRYTDYAQALRETAAEPSAEPDAGQAALL